MNDHENSNLTISRYQSRLKDVVSAYKSLLKEKEALETSIKALTSQKAAGTSDSSDPGQLALLSSLATLSAEKSRMEAGFQADKKQMRLEMAAKDQKIKEFDEKLKVLELEKETCKSKLIACDRMLSDEKNLKENLEFQLQQLKIQFITAHSGSSTDLNQENLDLRKKLKNYETNSNIQDSSVVIQALQREIENLKHQHVSMTKLEQQKASEANEKSRKLTAIHEKQVQGLEERLSELSLSVSNYHKLRELDAKQITHLKEMLFQLNDSTKQGSSVLETKSQHENELENKNSRLELPLDSNVINLTDAGFVSDEKYSAKKQLCKKLKSDNEALAAEIAEKSLHIKTLQEKVSVLNKNIDEYENEIKRKSVELNEIIKAERASYKESMNALEITHRSKISQLEQQIQKQRERSLVLLEEKENELRSLKTSYELFIPKKDSSSKADDDDDRMSSSSDARKTSHHLGIVLSQTPSNSLSNLPETHMIYYSNELARKEIELTGLRKAKREAESLMRQTLKEKISMQEAMDHKIACLEQQVDRLERTKSREGESLEYLKNVVISYVTATDQHKKIYLLTAIAAVLKLDHHEKQLVGLEVPGKIK